MSLSPVAGTPVRLQRACTLLKGKDGNSLEVLLVSCHPSKDQDANRHLAQWGDAPAQPSSAIMHWAHLLSNCRTRTAAGTCTVPFDAIGHPSMYPSMHYPSRPPTLSAAPALSRAPATPASTLASSAVTSPWQYTLPAPTARASFGSTSSAGTSVGHGMA